MSQTFKLAFRNIGRNKTRSLLSALAVAVGMALLLLMAAVLEGEMRGSMQNSIKLQSGHLQIRAASYDESKISLKWEDLIENPEQVVEKVKSLPQVTVVTPRLIASAILTIGDESKGVQILGVDPASYQIRHLVSTDRQGGRSTFSFTNLKENRNLSDKIFTFQIPRGVDVITNGVPAK